MTFDIKIPKTRNPLCRTTLWLMGLILAFILVAVPVFAYTYRAPVAVSENGTAAYTMLPITVDANNEWMADNGFMAASANDTRIETLSGLARPHMVADNKTLFAIAVPQSSQTNLYYSMGNSALTSFPIIAGYDGYITAVDNASTELSANFTVGLDGWVDTSATPTFIDDGTVAWSANATQQVWCSSNTTHFIYEGSSSNITTGTLTLANILVAHHNISAIDLSGQTYINLWLWSDDGITANDAAILLDDTTGCVSPLEVLQLPVIATKTWTNVVLTLATPGNLTSVVSVGLRNTSPGEFNLEILLIDSIIVGPSGRPYLVRKTDAFETYVTVAGNITSRIYDASGNITASVNATGVSSGESIVKVTETPALSFNATIGYVDITHSTSLNITSAITIETYFSAESMGQGNFGRLVAKEGGVWYINFANVANRLDCTIKDSGGGAHTVTVTGITYDVPHRLAVTYNGAIQRVVLDGELFGVTTSWADTIAYDAINVKIGNRQAGDRTWDGRIDEVRIYDRALTPAELTEHYNGIFTDETGLVGLWLLDEGSGSNAYDTSGEGNDGTILHPDWTTGALGIYVDNVLEDDAVGASVPDNANAWTFMAGNSMPYADNISFSVNGTVQLWYEPTTMILGTTLPDRAGTPQNGIFTWGDNPVGVTVDLGSLASVSQPDPGLVIEDPTRDILPPAEPSDWFIEPDVTGALLTNPLRPFVTMMSDNSTVTEIQAWRILALAMIMMVTVGTARAVKGHLLLAGIAAGVAIGATVALTIFPLWTLVFAIGAVLGGVVAERSPSL